MDHSSRLARAHACLAGVSDSISGRGGHKIFVDLGKILTKSISSGPSKYHCSPLLNTRNKAKTDYKLYTQWNLILVFSQ